MTLSTRRGGYALLVLALALVGAAILTGWLFSSDMQRARAHAAQGSVLIATRCGPIEYQDAGAGVPLLAVHGSGGGHDQGMAFAGALAKQGIRVIAMSRFGYLRTPMRPRLRKPMRMCACSTPWASAKLPSWEVRPARRLRCR